MNLSGRLARLSEIDALPGVPLQARQNRPTKQKALPNAHLFALRRARKTRLSGRPRLRSIPRSASRPHSAWRTSRLASNLYDPPLRCRCAGSADRPPLLEALAAEYRAALRRLERDRGLFPALRANRFGFDPLNVARAGVAALRAIALACLATLRLVLEALVGEKHLLAGGKYEFSPAFRTLQDLVMIFHSLLRGRVRSGRTAVQRVIQRRTRIRPDSRLSSARWHSAAWKVPSELVA